MVKINKEESIYVKKHYPSAYIIVVNRGRKKGYKGYYMTETSRSLSLLEEFRKSERMT